MVIACFVFFGDLVLIDSIDLNRESSFAFDSCAREAFLQPSRARAGGFIFVVGRHANLNLGSFEEL